MRLGMSKEAVLDHLAADYTLQKIAEDSWFISSKKGPQFRFMGGVGFRAGKVTWLSRDWGGSFHDSAAVSFAKELYHSLQSVRENSKSTVLVSTSEVFNQPELRGFSIEFQAEARKLV